jgi:Dolichyl-phosphate-mannose-protein mannosyltransferase
MKIVLVSILTLVGVLRIAFTYHVLSQAYDEPAHIACGMEWLSAGKYTLEPLHPPLARVAAALLPYLAGSRLPQVRTLQDSNGSSYDIFGAGNDILAQGNYFRILTLARLGILPFFLVSVTVVFIWTHQLFGEWAAVIAVLTYTTLPQILAFFGVAYTDPALAAFVPLSLFSFTKWLERSTMRWAMTLGLTTGLAILSKLTALLFLPACFVLILFAKTVLEKRSESALPAKPRLRCYMGTAGIALVVALLSIWAGYRFSIERLPKRPEQIAALHGLPTPLKYVVIGALHVSSWIPAPAFFEGVESDLRTNQKAPASYLLGRIRRGGWWYFFLVAVAVKTPITALLLSIVGAVATVLPVVKDRNWQQLVPLISAVAMLAVTLPAKVNYGVRHVLPIYPLLAIIAGRGALYLWQMRDRTKLISRCAVVVLLVWQIASTARAHPDYFSYFNEFADKRGADFLLWGCDLDCGQDTYRLANVLKARGIDNVTLCLFTSADVTHLGLPHVESCAPYRRTIGWIAASIRMLRTGDPFGECQCPDAYSWLSAYTPVATVGKTILLYYISASETVPQPTPLSLLFCQHVGRKAHKCALVATLQAA